MKVDATKESARLAMEVLDSAVSVPFEPDDGSETTREAIENDDFEFLAAFVRAAYKALP